MSKYKEPQFDLVLVINKLKSYANNPVSLVEDCKNWNVTLDDNWKPTIQSNKGILLDNDQLALQDYMHKALYYYDKGEDKMKGFLSRMIPMLEEWLNDYKEAVEKRRAERKAELEKQGLLCPECNQKGMISGMEYHGTGVIKINWEHAEGGPMGFGNHQWVRGSTEYQFHYKKCRDCGYWEMIEWRHTPNWFEDLINKIFNTDNNFVKGNIINEYKWGKFADDGFKSYEIIRW